MDLAENRFGKTWKHFLEVLKVDYNCSLADVCRDQHTTLGGMSSWMSRRIIYEGSLSKSFTTTH